MLSAYDHIVTIIQPTSAGEEHIQYGLTRSEAEYLAQQLGDTPRRAVYKLDGVQAQRITMEGPSSVQYSTPRSFASPDEQLSTVRVSVGPRSDWEPVRTGLPYAQPNAELIVSLGSERDADEGLLDAELWLHGKRLRVSEEEAKAYVAKEGLRASEIAFEVQPSDLFKLGWVFAQHAERRNIIQEKARPSEGAPFSPMQAVETASNMVQVLQLCQELKPHWQQMRSDFSGRVLVAPSMDHGALSSYRQLVSQPLVSIMQLEAQGSSGTLGLDDIEEAYSRLERMISSDRPDDHHGLIRKCLEEGLPPEAIADKLASEDGRNELLTQCYKALEDAGYAVRMQSGELAAVHILDRCVDTLTIPDAFALDAAGTALSLIGLPLRLSQRVELARSQGVGPGKAMLRALLDEITESGFAWGITVLGGMLLPGGPLVAGALGFFARPLVRKLVTSPTKFAPSDVPESQHGQERDMKQERLSEGDIARIPQAPQNVMKSIMDLRHEHDAAEDLKLKGFLG